MLLFLYYIFGELKMLSDLKLKNRKRLPPSAMKIINFIDQEGSGTSEEIMTSTGLTKRTLRYALRILLEEEVVRREPVLFDMRKVRYKF